MADFPDVDDETQNGILTTAAMAMTMTRDDGEEGRQGCQMAKFDPFLSLDCARVEGGGRNPRKGRDQILQRSVAERSGA